MIAISTTPAWARAHPGALIGLLEISGVDNTSPSPALDQRKQETEEALRERYRGFKRADFLALPVMAAYDRYYKRFNKTYHVQLQLESIVLKGKKLPSVSPAVDSYFRAEMETLILTAGHDLARLQSPLSIDVSHGGEAMPQADGEPKVIRAGDMVMRQSHDICCSILYGQEPHSLIYAQTSHILYVAYVPAGVSTEIVQSQLLRIEDDIHLFSPNAITEQKRLIHADLH